MYRFFTGSLVVALISLNSISFAQQTATPPAKPATAQQQQQKQSPKSRQQPDMGEILVKGLKGTDGCIDVKTCRWNDGKNSIVAWFENKDAAVTWYHSATHQAMIGNRTDGFDTDKKEPLEHVKSEDTPIMVIASLTFSSKPELPGIAIPISQISIEMFAPLPGGAMVGGRVSPKAFKVPHMKDYSAPPQKKLEGGK